MLSMMGEKKKNQACIGWRAVFNAFLMKLILNASGPIPFPSLYYNLGCTVLSHP
jgi:hypothetical protein